MEDFIVIGAGSAGAVMASRLSHDASVTLIEAGPTDRWWDPRIHMPAALSLVLSSRWYNWHYHSEPEPGLDGRRLYCPRGRVMGGSSSINGMIFVRGHPDDFNRWASEYGLEDWRYEDCLPWFRKMENVQFAASDSRGTDGPLRVSRIERPSALVDAWLKAGEQAGFPLSHDFNGESQEGVGLFDRSIFRGRHQSSARAYLDKPPGRLSIRTNAMVTRILIEQGRATGIEYIVNGRRHRLHAGEVIVCAGAISSPQLLMLSGIGPRRHLESLNIHTVHHLPGVGQNLQDHLEIYVQYRCLEPVSLYPATRWYRMPDIGLRWLLAGSGIGASNHFEAGAFLRSGTSATWPDLQYHFLPVAMDYEGKSQFQGHGFQFHVGPMKPVSRGNINLRSADPRDHPVVRFNYNTASEDREVMRRGIRTGMNIISQSAFDTFRGERIQPAGEDDATIDAFIRQHAESAYHPCGTCRMGHDDLAVVDSKGQVHGLSGLRIVDASIMPEITNGNLNAPVIMMAEKISAGIAG